MEHNHNKFKWRAEKWRRNNKKKPLKSKARRIVPSRNKIRNSNTRVFRMELNTIGIQYSSSF